MSDKTASAPDTNDPARGLDFRRIVDEMNIPYQVLDRDLNLVYANKAFYDLFGRTPEQLVGRNIFETFPESKSRERKILRYFERTLQGKTTVMDKEHYRIQQPDGSTELRCWQSIQTPFFGEDGTVTHILQQAVDITEEEAQKRQKELLARELDHRVKNMFAVIQAIANLASHEAQTAREFREDFAGRIVAMSRTYDALSHTDWEGLNLRDIFKAELAFYQTGPGERIVIEGPDIRFSAQACQNASLLIHELATNAAKHGSLSQPEGRLHISWEVDEPNDEIRIVWSETGLSGIQPPGRLGFGTQLTDFIPNIRKITRTYRDEGLLVRVHVPLRAIRFNPKRQLNSQVPASDPHEGRKSG